MKKLIALVLLTGFGGSLFAPTYSKKLTFGPEKTYYLICNLTDESINVKLTYTFPMWSIPNVIKWKMPPGTDFASTLFPAGNKRRYFDSLTINDVKTFHYDSSTVKRMLKHGENTIGVYKIGDAWGVNDAKGMGCSLVAKMLKVPAPSTVKGKMLESASKSTSPIN